MLYNITCFVDLFAPLHRVHPVTSPPLQESSEKAVTAKSITK